MLVFVLAYAINAETKAAVLFVYLYLISKCIRFSLFGSYMYFYVALEYGPPNMDIFNVDDPYSGNEKDIRQTKEFPNKNCSICDLQCTLCSQVAWLFSFHFSYYIIIIITLINILSAMMRTHNEQCNQVSRTLALLFSDGNFLGLWDTTSVWDAYPLNHSRVRLFNANTVILHLIL